MEFDIGRLALMGVALAAGAVVKGATGMGLPLVALPVLTTFFGLQHAVALMTVPILYTNLFQVWRFRETAREPRLGFLPLFLVGGAAGVAIGTWALTSLPERALVLALGVILLLYVVLRLAAPHWVIGPETARRIGPAAGLGAGILQGATGISAPIGATFIHAMSLGREALVFSMSAMFLLFALAQMASLWTAGVLGGAALLDGVLALIPTLIFMPVGQVLAARLSRRAFDRMILIFLGLIGVKMVLGL